LTDVQGLQLIEVRRFGTPSWLFNQALGRLRALVGTSIAVIIQTFDIDVDEHLAKVMPPPLDDDGSP